jgi:N6-L-threonylcarbamoyladenine synthase
LAFSLETPLVGVHHIKGHIFAALLENKCLEPPFLSLVVSGGHTNLIDVKDYETFEILGATRDDAVGEAYDKVARVLGLGYPGGPKVEKLAESGDPNAVFFKRAMLEQDSLDFSFSGIKTGVLNYMNSAVQGGREVNKADVAAGFQASILDVIEAKTLMALERTGHDKMTLGGGVASNGALRSRMQKVCDGQGVTLYLPSSEYCTDNAAMIACATYYDYNAGKKDKLSLDAKAVMEL